MQILALRFFETFLKKNAKWVNTFKRLSFRRLAEDCLSLPRRVWTCPVTVPKYSHSFGSGVIC